MTAPTPAELLAAKNAAERIVAARDAYDWRTSSYEGWRRYTETAARDAPIVARTLLSMPDVQAAHWTPALAGGRT